MKKRNILLAVFAAAAVVVGGCGNNAGDAGAKEDTTTAEKLVDPSAEVALYDTYTIDLSDYGQENSFKILFGDGDFVLFVNDTTVGEGTYTQEGNEVVLEAQDAGGNDLTNNRMIADGDKLLFESSMCQGTIPEGETFDAEVDMTDGIGTYIRYTFKKDGTYQVYEKGGKTAEKDAVTLNGTYKRKGNLIEQVLNGNELFPLYVYRGHVFTSYYTALAENESDKAS